MVLRPRASEGWAAAETILVSEGRAVAAMESERAAPATGETLAPVPERAEYYRGRQEAYQGLYEAVVG